MSSTGTVSQRKLALIAIATFVAGSAQAARIVIGEGGDLALVAAVCFMLVFLISAWQFFRNSRHPPQTATAR